MSLSRLFGVLASALMLTTDTPVGAESVRPAECPSQEMVSTAHKVRYEEDFSEAITTVRALKEYALKEKSVECTTWVVLEIKPLLSDMTTKGDGFARRLRAEIINALRAITGSDLKREFQGDELEGADLVEVDFRGADLARVRFRRTFLAGTDFGNASLAGAILTQAYLRNVKLAGADITGSDLTQADWFNAVGLTADQLGTAKRDSIASCPRDRLGRYSGTGFRQYFRDTYETKFSDLATKEQRELRAAWQLYGSAHGLCALVRGWGDGRRGGGR